VEAEAQPGLGCRLLRCAGSASPPGILTASQVVPADRGAVERWGQGRTPLLEGLRHWFRVWESPCVIFR